MSNSLENNLGNYYEWNKDTWNKLTSYYMKDRVPSALLISGHAGLGKNSIIRRFSSLLLCHKPKSGEPCGECPSCNLMINGTHVDFNHITTEDSNVIKIEQIRNLTQKLTTSSSDSNYKIAVIENADLMQEKAANALLKTLEEPLGKTILILISAKVSQLPITIRSRCSHISIKAPNLTSVKKYLSTTEQSLSSDSIDLRFYYYHGAPLKIIASFEDDHVTTLFSIIKKAFIHMNYGLSDLLSELKSFSNSEIVKASRLVLEDLLRYVSLGNTGYTKSLENNDFSIINSMNLCYYKLFRFYDYHAKIQKEIDAKIVWQQNAIIIDLYNRWQTIGE